MRAKLPYRSIAPMVDGAHLPERRTLGTFTVNPGHDEVLRHFTPPVVVHVAVATNGQHEFGQPTPRPSARDQFHALDVPSRCGGVAVYRRSMGIGRTVTSVRPWPGLSNSTAATPNCSITQALVPRCPETVGVVN